MVDKNQKNFLENEIKYCSVSLSTIVNNSIRFDASVYDKDVIELKTKMEKVKFPLLQLYGEKGFVRDAFYGPRAKRNYISKDNPKSIGFLGSSEMLNINPEPNNFVLLNEKTKLMRPEIGTLLLSRSGTIGNVTYVSKTLNKYLVSEHAIRLVCNEFPGYVYSFLKSDIGQKIVKSYNFGSVIKEIEPEHLKKVFIPNPNVELKQEINNLILKSFELRDESNELEKKADVLCNENLSKIDYDEPLNSKIFDVNISNIDNRLDASYYNPQVDMVLNKIKKFSKNLIKLKDSKITQDIILPGRFKRIYVEPEYGVTFIGGKEILELNPSSKKYLSLKNHKDLIEKKLTLKENMILVTCSGTVGKIALVSKHWENWTANQHIIRIIPNSIDLVGYIYTFLKSKYGKVLIERCIYGSVVDEINEVQIGDIEIPFLCNEKTQQLINDLILQSVDKRNEAFLLEQQAISLLEDKVFCFN